MRVLVTGMGGELGTRVAQLLEAEPEVEVVAGCDFVPPRRRLRRAEFHRIDPRDRERLGTFVEEFAPDAVAHFGVYEPASRMGPREAAERSETCTAVALAAAARAGRLRRVAVRSGLEVYGRVSGQPAVPDESVVPQPTTPYGQTCCEVETIALGVRPAQTAVTILRYAPVVGSHIPSPLGRVLRLPAVPVPAFSDPPFSLLHQDDSAEAMVSAIMRGYDGVVNVIGPGAASPWQVVRLGGRIPVPVAGPGWAAAAIACEVAGAPAPPHVLDVLRRGCTADGTRAGSDLGMRWMRSTQEICAELFEWATVTPIVRNQAVA
jgi:UDP-glucose 4-epimerase